MPASAPPSSRDPRIDLLKGLALLSIFVDHIPNNRLSDFTLHSFGFSDAADLFVLLAGISATLAYGRIFERDGVRVGLTRVLLRCLHIYGVQVALLLSTLVVVSLFERFSGMAALIVGPMLRDGWQGTMRGVALRALPSYLDILPLYVLLLGAFPLIRLGMVRSQRATIAASVLLYGAANVFHWNLRNVVDPMDVAHWYFDPFTWQLVFVLGCTLGGAIQRRVPLMTEPPRLLRAACWFYVVFAFVALDPWKLWPAPFGADFPGLKAPFTIFGNEPKTFVTPWRLANGLAITYLALTSPMLSAIARHFFLRPVVACGRNSLQVFALATILALFGRLIFRTSEVTAFTQLVVNSTGLGLMLLFGIALDRLKTRQPVSRPEKVVFDAPEAAQ